MSEKPESQVSSLSKAHTIEEIADFWDTHSLADYWDQTREVEFEVNIRGHRFLFALEPGLAKRLAARAHQRGISTETLINVWLTEKLSEVSREN